MKTLRLLHAPIAAATVNRTVAKGLTRVAAYRAPRAARPR